jgi:hypothetical protein
MHQSTTNQLKHLAAIVVFITLDRQTIRRMGQIISIGFGTEFDHQTQVVG